MRKFQILNNAASPIPIVLAMLVAALLFASPANAVTPADADAAFNALNKVYWNPDIKFFRKEETGAKKADFWFEAQLWDTVMDQYDRTHSDEVKTQINDLFDGFNKVYPDWTKNKYNDDIRWWTIACTRAYGITHDERYLKKARAMFDFVYDGFTDDKFGGGVYWLNEKGSKNTCVNCPTIIAAVRLAVLLNDPGYLEKAKTLYAWQKKTLADDTGKVFDAISFNKTRQNNRVNRGSLTYNRGTYIGAAVLLYQQTKEQTYLDDAIKTAQWTKDNLCVTDKRILHSEGKGDGGAFKGIFVRYMKLLINDCGRQEFLPWMKTNADVAWSNRRLADNIISDNWAAPAGTKIQSQSATSAVAVILCFADDAPRK